MKISEAGNPRLLSDSGREGRPPSRRGERLGAAALIVLALLGIAARLLISWNVIGTNDAVTWSEHARVLQERGLYETYRTDPVMNHPPLAAAAAVLADRVAARTGMTFFFAFRLMPIAADAASGLLLFLIFKRRHTVLAGAAAAAAYSWCPDALLVSGYHCNTDSIYAFFGLLAFYLAVEWGTFFGAGVALAAAVNAKLIPVVLAPALFAICRRPRDFAALGLGLALGVIPFVPPLLNVGAEFRDHVFNYNSRRDLWGVSFAFELLGNLPPAQRIAQWWGDWYTLNGRFLVLGSVGLFSLFAFFRRLLNGYEIGAAAMALFLILTPGFGVQYTVAVVPLLFAASLRAGLLYGGLSGLFLFFVYWVNWTGDWPAYSYFFTNFLPPPGPWFGLAAWAVLIIFAATLIARMRPAGTPDRNVSIARPAPLAG